MRIQKGGMCRCLGSGRWEGSNDSGEADAAFFNYLGLDCKNYWALWEYPLMDEGFMASENWKQDNQDEILRLLEKIIEVVSEHSSGVNLRRFDETPDAIEVALIVTFNDLSQLTSGKDALEKIDNKLKFSFIENKAIY